ncbi:MAG TPA: hypothetical protein VMF55_16360 [Solirubrobacterales bacterium]|nr:hypothetical protein [Solirubrobacterales bacterium]
MKRRPALLTASLILTLLAVPDLSQAAAAPAPAIPHLALRVATGAEEFDDEGEELEREDCEDLGGVLGFEEEAEEEEFEIEECEEEVRSKKPGAVAAPEQCRVRSAESSITTLPGADRIELTVRYLTYRPSTVSLGLKLKDAKGSLPIETSTRHLGKNGILHLTTKVSDAVMERAAKAKEFDVALRPAQTPGYCGTLLEQRLDARHPVGSSRVFTQRVG